MSDCYRTGFRPGERPAVVQTRTVAGLQGMRPRRLRSMLDKGEKDVSADCNDSHGSLPSVYRQAVSASGSGALAADMSASIFSRRVISDAKWLAVAEKSKRPVCSLTHATAGFEQMERYERGPIRDDVSTATDMEACKLLRRLPTMIFPVGLCSGAVSQPMTWRI